MELSEDKYLTMTEHAIRHLEIMLKAYSKSPSGIAKLINSILIVPDDYTCENFKTDFPKASATVRQHNKFISSKRFEFELLSASFDNYLNLTLKYICHLDDDDLEQWEEYIFKADYFESNWVATTLVDD